CSRFPLPALDHRSANSLSKNLDVNDPPRLRAGCADGLCLFVRYPTVELTKSKFNRFEETRMGNNRRGFLGQLASFSGVVVGRSALARQQEHAGHTAPPPQTPTRQNAQAQHVHGAATSTEPAGDAVLIETPDLPKLPFNLVDGVKEFHLIAQPVETELIPGKTIKAWDYNGSMPGPTIEVNEGDRVR